MPESPATAPVAREIDWWGRLADPAFLRDPYPQLESWRAGGPVQFDPASGVYFVLGHAALTRVLRAPEMGRDTRLWRDGWTHPDRRAADPVAFRLFTEFQPQMINSNPPDHRRMRAVYDRAFTPKAVAPLRAMVAAEAARLLDDLPADGEFDFIAGYAAPLPLRVLRNLFEMPPEMDAAMARWSAAIIKIGDVMMTAAQKAAALEALLEFKDYLRAHLAARRGAPGDGLLARVIAAYDGGVLDEDETLTNLVSMLIAGHETTVTLIGNGMLSLLENPAQLARIRADPGLIRPALEEFMRIEPGGNMILRIAIEDLEVAGVTIPAGAACVGLVGAVNRDPAVFADPARLDVGRAPNPHLTFGGGIHFCVGAPLARLEGEVAFGAFLARYPALAAAGPHAWRLDRMNARGLATLPVCGRPAGAAA